MINEHLKILAEDLSGLMDFIIFGGLIVLGVAGKIYNSIQVKKQQEKMASQPKSLNEKKPENIESVQAQNKPKSVIAGIVENVKKAYEEQMAQQQPQQQTKAVAQPPATPTVNDTIRKIAKVKPKDIPLQINVTPKPKKSQDTFGAMNVPVMADISVNQTDPKIKKTDDKAKRAYTQDLFNGTGKDLKKAFIYYEVFSKPLATRQQNIF